MEHPELMFFHELRILFGLSFGGSIIMFYDLDPPWSVVHLVASRILFVKLAAVC